jgi:ribonuclease-3
MQARSRFAQLYDHLGYTFSDEILLQQALTHRSASKKHNERLEFLGDAVLGMVIGEKLFEAFPDETLADIGSKLALGDVIQLGSGEMKSGGHRRASILADAVEAILGAVYRESGFDTVKKVILQLFAPRIAQLDPNAHPKDSKTRLQEWLQARKLKLPEYAVETISGKDHNQTFEVSCQVQNQPTKTLGRAQSRRRAEQEAALKMLNRLLDDNE